MFITFVVILVTLVFQGLTLPVFLKILKVEETDDFQPAEEQIESIRLQLARDSVAYLDEKYAKEMEKYETIARIKEQLLRSIAASEKAEREDSPSHPGAVRVLYVKIMLEGRSQAKRLSALNNQKNFEDDLVRDLEYNLDGGIVVEEEVIPGFFATDRFISLRRFSFLPRTARIYTNRGFFADSIRVHVQLCCGVIRG